MPLPIAAAIPWIASAVGSFLPAIVDSFRSGKSPEEAQKIIAPQRQAMIERLIGSGMNMQQAEAMTDEAMSEELEKAQLPEPMSPWLTAAMAIGGGIGGYKLGKMAAGKFAPAATDATKAAKIDTPAEQAVAKPASGQEASPMDVQSAMSAGMPLTKGRAVVTKGGGDVEEMLSGSPFPEAATAGMPLSIGGKLAKPPKASNVDMMAMMGSPFPR